MTTTGMEPLIVVDDKDDGIFTGLGESTAFRRILSKIDEVSKPLPIRALGSKRSPRHLSSRTRPPISDFLMSGCGTTGPSEVIGKIRASTWWRENVTPET